MQNSPQAAMCTVKLSCVLGVERVYERREHEHVKAAVILRTFRCVGEDSSWRHELTATYFRGSAKKRKGVFQWSDDIYWFLQLNGSECRDVEKL